MLCLYSVLSSLWVRIAVSYVDMIGCVRFSKYLDANMQMLDKFDKKHKKDERERRGPPGPEGGSSGGTCGV